MITKFIAGKFKYPVTITKKGGSLWFDFPYNKELIDSIRLMEGAKYHGYDEIPIKVWSVSDSLRNHFQISRLEGKNPYILYDKALIDFTPNRDYCYNHQVSLIKHFITRQYCIGAAEPAVGKTLAAIEAMEWLAANKGIRSWFYVAPKSALVSVNLEFQERKAQVWPQFFTYEALKSVVENWPKDSPPPKGLIVDESQRCKNPTAQRSIAVKHLADAIRLEWGSSGAVLELSGTPAPNNPADFWHQVEIACPGFFIEGTQEKFKRRLAFLEKGTSDSGQIYHTVKSWRDDENKCNVCGKLETDSDHDIINSIEKWFHPFQNSINEVAKVFNRMKGLVLVQLKKDCLQLPEKIFKLIECKPTQSTLNAAKLIVARGGPAIQVMILLRELSDGFQYQKIPIGKEPCPICNGSKIQEDHIYIGPDGFQETGLEIPPEFFNTIQVACPNCNGTGESIKYDRATVQVPCPKEDALIDLLDQYEDVGRLVTYAGFTGSVDRCVQVSLRMKWDVIRIDGRGWWSNLSGDSDELYRKFKKAREEFPRINIVAQPGAGGTGLNLQESPAEIFYSNDFNGESRLQAIERIHRLGMDENRGATIYDLIHLPTDLKVLENLNNKKKLQDITLGEFKKVLENGNT